MDTFSEIVDNVTNDINYLECQLENAISTIYKILAKQYPSEILSAILGEKRPARTTNDIISELTCEDVEAEILKSLIHNGIYYTRPLVKFVNSQNKTVLGQIHSDGYVYTELAFFENLLPGNIMSFQINANFYTYTNYSLYKRHDDIKKLKPSLRQIKESYKPRDYETILTDLPRPSTGMTDLNSVLIEMSNLRNMRKALLRKYGAASANQWTNKAPNPLHSSNDLFSEDKIVGYLTSPVRLGLYNLGVHLAIFWGFVLTLLAIKYVIQLVIKNKDKIRYSSSYITSSFRNRFGNNRQDIETPSHPQEIILLQERPKIYPNLE